MGFDFIDSAYSEAPLSLTHRQLCFPGLKGPSDRLLKTLSVSAQTSDSWKHHNHGDLACVLWTAYQAWLLGSMGPIIPFEWASDLTLS